MKNIKEFSNHTDYKRELFPLKSSKVSLCNDEEEIHYNFEGESCIIITYDVKDDSQLTQLCYYLSTDTSKQPSSFFSKIITEYEEIPVTTLQNQYGEYQLPLGINIIKYFPKVSSAGFFSYAFKNCTSIIKAEIPSSITGLGSELFYGCSNLEYVKLHDNLRSDSTATNSNIFFGCNIKCFKLPASFMSINWNMLGENPIQYITVDPDNPVYDSRNNCNAIIQTNTNKLISGSSNTIIPEDVVQISAYAFQKNLKLTKINIPENVTGSLDSFSSCSNLEEVIINSNYITSQNYSASKYLRSIFGGSSKSKKFILGDNITNIGDYAFYTSYIEKLPDNLLTIGNYSFAFGGSYFFNTTSITIPRKVTSIGNNAFSHVKAERIDVLPTVPPTLGTNAFYRDAIIYVPRESEELYKTALNWNEYQIFCREE